LQDLLENDGINIVPSDGIAATLPHMEWSPANTGFMRSAEMTLAREWTVDVNEDQDYDDDCEDYDDEDDYCDEDDE
jgi:hypothetical protein